MMERSVAFNLRVLSLLPLLLSFNPVHATNDWSTPCFDGVCQYSLNSSNSGSGTMKIWGSSDAITDITTAAGWEILNCSATALAQDIRLVCLSDNTTDAGCDHLFQNIGAEDKLVRLPEGCGASPFARVARAWVSEDQTIPGNVSERIVRNNGSTPQVHALTLDTNFSAIDTSKTGTVSIAIRGANFPGANVNGTLDTSASESRRRGHSAERGLFGFVGNAIRSISDLDDFNITKSIDLPPISANQSATLLNQNLTCGDLNLNLDVGVDGSASAQASLGIAAAGTIIPPKFDEFAVIVGFNANLDGSIDINADVGGTFDTGKITIFSVGIPGLDIPGILSLGPTFSIDAEATAQLDVDVDMTVGVNYAVTNAQLVFPPNDDISSGGSFTINDTPLQLSLSPGVEATGNVTAHLIPTISLGVSALAGVASATIFLDLDASATLQLALDASDNTNVTIADSNNTSTASASSSSAASKRYVIPRASDVSVKPTSIPQAVSHAKVAARALSSEVSASSNSSASSSTVVQSSSLSSSVSSTVKSASLSSSSSASKTSSTAISSSSASSTASSAGAQVTSSSSSSFGGCVELDVGFDVNAGAQGSLFGLFSDSTQVTLFSKEFQLFQKCFGDGAAASKRSQSTVARGSSLERRSRQRRDSSDSVLALLCPSSGVTDAEDVVDDVVKAARQVLSFFGIE